MPKEREQREPTFPLGSLEMIQEKIAEIPKGLSAVFICDDDLQAIKVVERLRLLMGEAYIYTARRSCVYVKCRKES